MRTIWSAVCALLLGTAMPSAGWGFEVEIVVEGGSGAIYPIRWGQSDTNDLVTPYPRWESPFCVKKGSKIGVRIVWEFAEIKDDWAVVWEELSSKVVPLQYWNDNTCIQRHSYHQPNDVHWFVDDADQWPQWADYNIPDFIEWAFLRGDLISLNPMEGPGGAAAYESDVFVVLDQPQAPMDPAWVSVLQVSCKWERTSVSSLGASTVLTVTLHGLGEYNGGYPGYTRYVEGSEDDGECFFLKAFIDRPNFPWGQCNDFADFLDCLITSVGAYAATAQRTNPLGLGWWFRTNLINPAGPLPPVRTDWNYHQFVLTPFSGPRVWDGCVYFEPPTTPVGWPLGWPIDTYYGGALDVGLVEKYEVGQWQPTPTAGFVPELHTETGLQIPAWPFCDH